MMTFYSVEKFLILKKSRKILPIIQRVENFQVLELQTFRRHECWLTRIFAEFAHFESV